MSKLFSRKILLALVLACFILTPAFFYLKWFLLGQNFRYKVEEQIGNFGSFSYDNYSVHGFFSRDLNLEFENPVFYAGEGKNRLALKFQSMLFAWRRSENKILVFNGNDNKFNAKFAGEKFFCSGIKFAQIHLNEESGSFALEFDEKDIACVGEDLNQEKVGDIVLKIDGVLNDESQKFINIDLIVEKDNIKKIDCNADLHWEKSSIKPRYSANLKKIKLNNDNMYKVYISGSPSLSFSYKYNFGGNLVMEVWNYEEFFRNMLANKQEDGLKNAKDVVEFLRANSKIDGDTLLAEFTGKDGDIFLNGQSASDALAKMMPAV